jgi:ribokinase
LFDIITIGGASRDVFFLTDEGKVINDLAHHQKLIAFEYGSKIIPKKTDFSYGGGGANTAISFTKLGLHTATIMNIGIEGTGSLIVKELEATGVSCEHVTRDRINHTALSTIVSLPNEDHTMFLYRGSNDYMKVHDWRPIHTGWFYLSSLTGESVDIIPEMFSYARAHNIKVAWNPGHEQLVGDCQDLASFIEDTNILILNKEEACSLVRGMDGNIDLSDIKKILTALTQISKGIVVVTDGEYGSYTASDGKQYHEPAHSTEVVETTGAGDAYGSTFVAAHIKGFGIKYAMKLAAENAAKVVSFVGAQSGLMTFDELRAKIDGGDSDEN